MLPINVRCATRLVEARRCASVLVDLFRHDDRDAAFEAASQREAPS